MTPVQNMTDQELAMTSVEAELAAEYSDVDPRTIHDLVAEGYAALTPAKVTSFLPILVIRGVQARLRLDGIGQRALDVEDRLASPGLGTG
jgi:hypothetical protein